MRKFLSLLCLLAVAWSISGQASAVERSLGNMSVPHMQGVDTLGLGLPTILGRDIGHPNVPVTLGYDAELIRMLPKGNVEMTLIRPAQYNCRADCHNCRETCSIEWKGQCRGPQCRKGFSDCMKWCWQNICRNCN